MADIAKQLNVSTAAVSFVLNGKPGVSARKREQIADLLRREGYAVKKFNEQLNNGSLPCLRFIKYRNEGYYVDNNGDYVTRLMDGAELAATQSGLDLIVDNADKNDVAGVLAEAAADRHTLGVLFLGTEFDHRDCGLLHRLGKPFVVVDARLQYCPVNCVAIDNRDSIAGALGHLVELGHKKICFLSSNLHLDEIEERDVGFRRAAEKLRIDPGDIVELKVAPDFQLAYETVLEHLRQGGPAGTGYLCSNDTIALGALKAFRQMEVRIPEEVSVIGFDNLLASSMSDPPLTTMAVDSRRIGRLAVERLMHIITTCDDSVQKLHIDATLIVRGTTAAARI